MVHLKFTPTKSNFCCNTTSASSVRLEYNTVGILMEDFLLIQDTVTECVTAWIDRARAVR